MVLVRPLAIQLLLMVGLPIRVLLEVLILSLLDALAMMALIISGGLHNIDAILDLLAMVRHHCQTGMNPIE